MRSPFAVALLMPFIFGLVCPQEQRPDSAKSRTSDEASATLVELSDAKDDHRVDVSIGGHLFTSYQFGPEFKDKPVFYPILTRHGNMVNRGYPMRRDIQGESQDAEHQQSLFFCYGNVNGTDYWNPRPQRRIVHKGILGRSGGTGGLLDLILEWVDPQGTAVLQERKKVTFGGSTDCRWMDHEICLTALSRPVIFGDTKEGMFALRVAPSLQERERGAFYINAYGQKTAKVIWGKRAPWVALSGEVNGEDVTVAIFDHPSTENYPSYWHVREYGLFAANPFGRKDFVSGATALNKSLLPNQSFHIRYRLIIYEGKEDKDRLDKDYWEFVQ